MADRKITPLGGLLRHYRSARKLSQLELALEAGVSARHLSFVETGRAQPSREMVLLLAQVLDVPLRERNNFLRAAGYADLYRETDLDAPELASVRRALQFLLDRHEPYGAFVLDRSMAVKLANQAASKVLGRFVVKLPPPPVNVMRLLFDPEGVRPFVDNWDEIARVQIQRLHREAMVAEEDAPVRALLTELLAMPGVPRAWQQPDLGADAPPLIPLVLRRDGVRLSLFSTIACIGTPLDVTLHELRIETFFPADAETEAAMQTL